MGTLPAILLLIIAVHKNSQTIIGHIQSYFSRNGLFNSYQIFENVTSKDEWKYMQLYQQKKHWPAGDYMFKVNNRDSRTRCEIYPKLTIKTPERRHWRRSGVFIVNFEHISHLVLFLLLTLKLVSAIFYEIFIFSPNDSPSKTIKNVFYFIKKAIFVLEIFKLL